MATENASNTKKIKVSVTFGYSLDQVTVNTYEPGEHEVPEEVAEYAVANKKATLVK